MRISDWSSDVCSSDLISPSAVFGSAPAAEGGDAIEVPEHDSGDDDVGDRIGPVGDAVVLIAEEEAERRQEAGPDEGAEGGEEQEAAQVHDGAAGRHRAEGAHRRPQRADDDSHAAVVAHPATALVE